MVFSQPRYPRYAFDLSDPAIRYAIAAAITVSAITVTFPNNGPCLICTTHKGPIHDDKFAKK